MNGWTEKRKDGQTVGQINGQMGGKTDTMTEADR
jgi:hypothetical protein